MSQNSRAAVSELFLTVEEVLAEHERLLAVHGGREDAVQIRSFVERLVQSGAYFDEAAERKALQGTLDYWTSELARHATDHESADHRRRSMHEFEPDALGARQHDFKNPFGSVAEQMGALDPRERHSPAAILRLITDTAKTQKLRFQEGLLKEIVSQVSGDSEKNAKTQARHDKEDAALLEFCLWHLFEDPETRIGNKIYRPKKWGEQNRRIDYFSCKVYLLHKAETLDAALPNHEREVLLDELMRISGSNADARRPRPWLGSFLRKVRRWIRSTGLQAKAFPLYAGSVPNLAEFLQASRLASNEGGQWRLVHPALAQWPPLRERTWKAAENDKLLFLFSTAIIVAAATSLAWLGWYKFWTDRSLAYLAKAQISTDTKQRLAASVAGLRASNLSMGSDTSYATQVANDAIGAVIGERARAGQGAVSSLEAYPDAPHIECERIQSYTGGFTYAVTAAYHSSPGMKFSSLNACPMFTVNFSGTRLAAAWQEDGRVTMRVFEIAPDFRLLGSGRDGALVDADLERGTETKAWMAGLRELRLEPPLGQQPAELTHVCKDRALRFGEDDRTLSFECLYSEGSDPSTVQWIAAGIKDHDVQESQPNAALTAAIAGIENVVADTGNLLAPCHKGSREPLPPTSRVTSVFLGPRASSSTGFVTVRGDGYVQVWHDNVQPPCLSSQFRSDFIRVATGGRPVALDVQDVTVPGAMYAIHAFTPAPVVRVYGQHQAKKPKLLMEHYPPAGVGTPFGITFTTNAQCLQIRAKRKSGGALVAVDYYLILDPKRLLAVGQALEKDLNGQPAAAGGTLQEYKSAIESQCYGT